MSSIVEKVDEQEDRLKKIEEALLEKQKKKEKSFTLKIPSKIVRSTKKPGVSAALWLGHNRKAQWQKVEYKDGLLWVGKNAYSYESGCTYFLSVGRRTVPLVLVYEWRLDPVGGKSEEYKSRLIGGENDEDLAESMGLQNYGQMTIVRAIEQAEIDKTDKKKGNLPLVWIIIGVVVVIYLIAQAFGAA